MILKPGFKRFIVIDKMELNQSPSPLWSCYIAFSFSSFILRQMIAQWLKPPFFSSQISAGGMRP